MAHKQEKKNTRCKIAAQRKNLKDNYKTSLDAINKIKNIIDEEVLFLESRKAGRLQQKYILSKELWKKESDMAEIKAELESAEQNKKQLAARLIILKSEMSGSYSEFLFRLMSGRIGKRKLIKDSREQER